MTKKEMFTLIDGIIDESTLENKEEVHEFISHEIEMLNRKSISKGMTKTQKENEILKNEIFNALLETNGSITISELQANNESLNRFSNQKITALLSQMVTDNRVTREVIKKKAYYTAVVE